MTQPTTKAELAELKRVAEAANDDKGVGGLQKILATRAGAKHINTFNPETVLRLLADVERLERALRNELPKCDGCRGTGKVTVVGIEYDCDECKAARAALGGE